MFVCNRPLRSRNLPKGVVYGLFGIGTAWIGMGCSDDDDVVNPPGKPAAVAFSAPTVTVSEMTRNLDLQIVRNGDDASSVNLELTLVSETAGSPADFLGGTRQITLPAGTDEETVSIPIVADAIVEADETFRVEIASASNASIEEPRSVDVTITDLATDFQLPDVNPNSASHGAMVSPRDEMQKISAWYFGHAT